MVTLIKNVKVLEDKDMRSEIKFSKVLVIRDNEVKEYYVGFENLTYSKLFGDRNLYSESLVFLTPNEKIDGKVFTAKVMDKENSSKYEFLMTASYVLNDRQKESEKQARIYEMLRGDDSIGISKETAKMMDAYENSVVLLKESLFRSAR
ncbi:hypothetical protein Mia14_0004 [Candidatus Mancarchaeum acidiphilum]|uniref:Uncharacterized protein n=1 Tax=Candidatus Mancarchaeum acidiphilum TaxID=1920749 RepID=A0A218NLL2_9ARCH|nr:hypothetical protein [Candidatus Mancarchaeum acidiphilum]ASI13353.1 hypothetical protein Mia14_0004 [Candidatus Mancarchaeum acidiphilum]